MLKAAIQSYTIDYKNHLYLYETNSILTLSREKKNLQKTTKTLKPRKNSRS